MNFQEAFDFVKTQPIENLVFPTEEGGMTYAPAVDIVLLSALEDFDTKTYDDYVKTAKFRADLLELRDNKKKVEEFSKADLQLFLVIQQKAEAIMKGQIAVILDNGILVKTVERILSL